MNLLKVDPAPREAPDPLLAAPEAAIREDEDLHEMMRQLGPDIPRKDHVL